MNMMLEQMTRVAMQRSMEEQAPKIPPASERVRDALPRVVVTKEHWQPGISLFNAVNSGTTKLLPCHMTLWLRVQ